MMPKKVICPSCGAVNSSSLYKCRLCGHVLEFNEDHSALFLSQPREVITGRPKYGVGKLVWLAALLVGLLAALLLFFGVIQNQYFERALTILENQRASEVPGWTEIYADGENFRASLPGNEERLTKQTGALPSLFVNGNLVTGSFDDFDTAYVAWGTLGVARSESDLVTAERVAEAYAIERGGVVQNFSFGLVQNKPTGTFDVFYPGVDPIRTKAFISIEGEKGWLGAVDSSTDAFPLYDTFRQQFIFTP